MVEFRFSKQRQMIYDTIALHKDHPTADKIYTRIKPHYPQLSLGTVYRNLRQLEQTGTIIRIPTPDGCDHFDARCENHYHLQCQNCKEVFDLNIPLSQSFVQTAQVYTDHKILGCDILFFGICEACDKPS